MINNINIKKEEFNIVKPYPYYFQDNYLENTFARNIQNEILNINKNEFDRYSNPFESKNTLRDKNKMPKYLNELFTYWTSDIFIKQLSDIVGYNLFLDNEKNFWGVHTYENNDKLDIHMDAGLHPNNKMKKQVTIGLYLSLNYSDKNGCNFEIWDGSNIGEDNPKLYTKVDSIAPLFNRFIMFLCNDYAWHGNPEPVIGDSSCKRIFITISYLSENYSDKNKRVKAYFIKRPEDPEDSEKDTLRILRSDPLRYNEVYRL
jgi:Rps23 Pro-64 3,4-dihydroxylase Tpa1-like proline 4-hydroxylase